MKKYIVLPIMIIALLISVACNTPVEPEPTAVAIQSTATTEPTVEPTATKVPPTRTPDPTATQVAAPATATAIPTSTAAPTEEPTATATEVPTDVPTEKPTAEPTIAPTATSEPSSDEATAEGSGNTETENSSEGTTEPSPTTAAAPVTSGPVEQPPYEASSCSDRYPCNDDPAGWEARIRVPAGYRVQYFAYIPGQQPTGMAYGPDGLLYVATQGGTIYTVDSNGNANGYVSGLIAPTGIAFRPGTSQLYVSSRVREDNLDGEAQIVVIEGGGIRQLVGGLPCCYAFMHGPHGIVFGVDGMGYVGVGARSDHGELLTDPAVQAELHPYEAGIMRFDPNSGAMTRFADGLRNPYGLAIDGNGTIFATDNGPDYGPPDEMHRIVAGANHGYPWYDCAECFPKPAEVNPLAPTYNFIPHSSPTGMVAYKANQFPGGYNNLFVTLWSAFPGAQKVMRFGPNGVGASDFAMGFAAPIDVEVDTAGNLYIADWATGIIFKISYTG